MRTMTAVCLAFLMLAASGCVTNPVTGEEQLRIISTSEEVAMGVRLDEQVRSQYKVVTGTAAADRVERIGRRIAAVSDRDDIEYHFALIAGDELNAFAAPGGFIYVTSELLNVAENDAELAAVIAHEVGHVAALHSVNQIQLHLGYRLLSALVFGKDKETEAEAADVAFNTLIATGFSRRDEFQADELGVKYAAKAGYDPYGLANFFAKLQQREQEGILDKALEIVRSHPITSERRRRAEGYAAAYAGGR